MSRLSRRGFLALGGSASAAVAVGACGEAAEPREEGDDTELLGAAIGAESGYAAAAKASADQQGVSAGIEKASAARREEFEAAAEGADAAEATAGSGSVTDAAMAAIVAYRDGARRLSTEELRTTATQFAAQVAGELAALNELNGDEIVPYAFVTGLDEPPLQSADDAPSGETTTTEETTTTTSEGG